MAPYKVILAYDGTEFLGFQRQASGRTVQDSVEQALRKIGWNDASIIGAGRTDSGVHASGQVVGFDHEWEHTSEDLRDALNANLPADIAVIAVERVDEGFHPRYSALARSYTYRLFCDRVRQPLKERYAWRVWPPVSLDILHAVSKKVIGEHDFSAFGSPLKPGGSTIREIFSASWRSDQDYFLFEILGNAFLYHMVRRLVNFQVEIGQGKREIEDFDLPLSGECEETVQGLAPARGLVLKEVRY
jgi:tRNA pseudouridine38-40 synthase